MTDIRRRSGRLLAAENKSPAKPQYKQNSSDDESNGIDDDSDKDFPAKNGPKRHAQSRKGIESNPQQLQSPAERVVGRRSPVAALRKRKAPAVNVGGADDAVEDDEQAVAAVAAAGPGPSSVAAAAGVVEKPKAPPKRGKMAPMESLRNLTLWDIITKHPNSVERAAKEWVDRYCTDQLQATSELLTMVVQAGGCDSGVSTEDIESGDMDEVIHRLVNTIVQEGGTEPFRDKKLRKLRSSYETFWESAVEELHAAGRLLDDFLSGCLTSLLVGMSVTKVRGYRHAGTLTAGLLMTGWVRAQQQLTTSISTARHQEEAARKQKSADAVKKRMIDSLQRQAESLQSMVRQFKSLLEATFSSVFAVRFRDVGPDIRSVVIDLVGRWIGLLPATFMVDQYLKYVAWALSDIDAGVRAVAVSRLLELFGGSPTAPPTSPDSTAQPPSHLPLLHDFITRFTSRFKELPDDINEEVAVLGVRLLTRLVAVGALTTDTQLPAADCYRLLVDNPPAIRRVAAELAGQLLHEDAAKLDQCYAQHAKEAAEAAAASAAAPTTGSKAGRSTRSRATVAAAPLVAATASGGEAAVSLLSDPGQRKNASMLGAILEMMALLRTSYSVATAIPADDAAARAAPLEPELVEELVDALYDSMPVLRSWRLLVDCLSDDLLATIWGPMGIAHLTELVAAAVKHVRKGASAAMPAEMAGLSARRVGPRARALAHNGEVLQEASQVLLAALPRLLRRHQTDQTVASILVTLLRDVKLELFSLHDDEAGWRALMELVGEQLASRGTLPDLLTTCAETLTFAAVSGPPALRPSVGAVLREVYEQLATSLVMAATAVRVMDDEDLVDAVIELAAGDAGADAEELVVLRVALLRVHAVLARGCTALAADSRIYDALDELLAGCGSGRFLGPEITGMLAVTQLLVLLNNLDQMKSSPGGPATPMVGAGSGPSDAGVTDVVPVRKLQQARDALVAHMVSLHTAAAEAAQDKPVLEPHDDEPGGIGRGGLPAAQRLQQAHGNTAVMQEVAFRVLSDLALLFGSSTWKGTPLESLPLLTLSSQVADLMWRHCAEVLRLEDTRVNEDEEQDDEEDEGEKNVKDDLAGGPRSRHSAADSRVRRLGAVARKMEAVGCVGRLLAHAVYGDHHRAIAVNLTAEFCNHGPEVADLIRDVCREVAASRSHGEMPHIYVGALRQSWSKVTSAGELGEEEEDQALQHFAELAKHIASMYAGHGTSRSELLQILYDLTTEALQDAPTNLAILAWGAASFVPKLMPQDAAALVGELEARLSAPASGGHALHLVHQRLPGSAGADVSDLAHDRDDPDWAPLYHYLRLIKDKASKGRVAPRALKGGSATTPKAARNRRIHFAPSPHDFHDVDEEDNDAQPQHEVNNAVGARVATEVVTEAGQARKKARDAAAVISVEAAEEGGWLRKAMRAVGTAVPEQHDYNDEEEGREQVGPKTRVLPSQQSHRHGFMATGAAGKTARPTNAPPEVEGHDGGDDNGDGGKGSPVGATSPLRNVDTVPLVSMRAHTPTCDTSQTRSRSRSRGDVSVGLSLQAVSDLCAISDLRAATGPQSLQEVELFDGDPRWPSGEPSDLRAAMHSVRTASGCSREAPVEQEVPGVHQTEHDDDDVDEEQGDNIRDEDMHIAEANDGNDISTILPTEEDLPSHVRRTPDTRHTRPTSSAAALAQRTTTATTASAPSVSANSLAARSGEVGSLHASEVTADEEDEVEFGEAGASEDSDEGEDGEEEVVGDEAANDSETDGSHKEGEGVEEPQALAPRFAFSGRKRRLTDGGSGEAGSGATANDGGGGSGSDELRPLPSASWGAPAVSLRADSVATQEPPQRRAKRRRQ